MMHIREIIWGRIFLWFFRPLYKIENVHSIWRNVVNRRAVAHFKHYGNKPDAIEARILADLNQDGIAFSSLGELFGAGKLDELLSAANFDRAPRRTNRQKPFISEFFEEMPTITDDSKFAEAALSERVLTIVSTYLGMSPRFQEFTLTEINAVPGSEPRTSSMRWHRDPHDRRLLKMFIYFTDVGENNGPFTYVRGSNYPNTYSKIFPQVPPAGVYPPDGDVEKKVNPKDVVKAMGNAGTVVFADTAGLHRGGYVLKDRRRMLTAGFLPPKSFLVRQLSYKKKEGETFSPLKEYALFSSEWLFSRSLYKFLKGSLLGSQSLGGHITGMTGTM